MLDCTPVTVRNYINQGKIEAERISIKSAVKGSFKYVIKEEVLLELMKLPKIKSGPTESGTKIGPYRITRVNGELVTERVG